MVVVDTNVLAYLLFEGDRTAEAQALYTRDSDWRSEGFVLVEFSNILTTYHRTRALTVDVARGILERAERLMSGLVQLPYERALAVAMEFGVSAYDARFLAVARQLRTKLVTEDAKLRQAAPALTRSMADALIE